MPSKTFVEFDALADCYIAHGCIVNLTNRYLKGSVKGRFEIISTSYSSYIIAEQNKSEVLKLMKEHLTYREILSQKCDSQIEVNLLTINNINLSEISTESVVPGTERNLEKRCIRRRENIVYRKGGHKFEYN